MLLGDVCTRHCTFCNIPGGRVAAVDADEPRRVAEAVARAGVALRGGHLGQPRRPARRRGRPFRLDHPADPAPESRLRGRSADPRFPGRSAGARDRARGAARRCSTTTWRPCRGCTRRCGRRRTTAGRCRCSAAPASGRTVSRRRCGSRPGIMVGVGETFDEVVALMRDAAPHGVQTLTIGQYSAAHRAAPPGDALGRSGRNSSTGRRRARSWGSTGSSPGPWCVRSYHAREQSAAGAAAQDSRAPPAPSPDDRRPALHCWAAGGGSVMPKPGATSRSVRQSASGLATRTGGRRGRQARAFAPPPSLLSCRLPEPASPCRHRS